MLQVQLSKDAAKTVVNLSQMCWQIALITNKTEVVACLSLPSPEGRLDTGLGISLVHISLKAENKAATSLQQVDQEDIRGRRGAKKTKKGF